MAKEEQQKQILPLQELSQPVGYTVLQHVNPAAPQEQHAPTALQVSTCQLQTLAQIALQDSENLLMFPPYNQVRPMEPLNVLQLATRPVTGAEDLVPMSASTAMQVTISMVQALAILVLTEEPRVQTQLCTRSHHLAAMISVIPPAEPA